MTLKRAVFVTTKAAETYRGFKRAIQYVRPDMLLDTRVNQRYDFGSLNRPSALRLEPGMRFLFSKEAADTNPEVANPPPGHEGDWYVIVMVDHSGSPSVEHAKSREMMARWHNAGWAVSQFDPKEDYEPLRASTPTEDRSNPLAVDAKIEGLHRQVSEMSQRLKAMEESERGTKPSYYEDLQRRNEGEVALQAVLAKGVLADVAPPPEPQPKYLFRDAEYTRPSVLVKMALSAVRQGANHVTLQTSGIRLLGQGMITQTLVLKDTDFLWTLDAIDTQTEMVPHNPIEAWDLLIHTLLTKNIPHVLFGGSSAEAVRGLLELAKDLE